MHWTYTNPTLRFVRDEWVRILFINEGLGSKLQYYGTCQITWKKSKTSHLNWSNHIEDDTMSKN
jgi:hypothetical protein